MKKEKNILRAKHIGKLFEVTELHYKWLNTYYPNNNHIFSKLLYVNYLKISNYIIVDLLGNYDLEAIDSKFNKMCSAYISLFEIAELNRKNKIMIAAA